MSTSNKIKLETREIRETNIPIDYVKANIAKMIGVDIKKTNLTIDLTHNYLTVKWYDRGSLEVEI